MAVLALKTELRCKLCSSAKRLEIDQLLERRSNGESDDAGKRINGDYVIAKLSEWGVANPNIDNIKNHWKKHCQVVTPQKQVEVSVQTEERHAAVIDVFERIVGPEWRTVTPTPDQLIELQRSLYLHDIDLKIRNGEPLGITHDHVLKGVAEATKRKADEAQAELLKALGDGMGQVFGAVARGIDRPRLPDPEPVLELPAVEFIEEAELDVTRGRAPDPCCAGQECRGFCPESDSADEVIPAVAEEPEDVLAAFDEIGYADVLCGACGSCTGCECASLPPLPPDPTPSVPISTLNVVVPAHEPEPANEPPPPIEPEPTPLPVVVGTAAPEVPAPVEKGRWWKRR